VVTQQPLASRYDWVDAAKGISIFLVVMVHVTIWLEYAGMEAGDLLSTFNEVGGHVRMPTFFAMSGIFAAKWLRATWRQLLANKLALLVWTFLLWQIAMFGYKSLGGAVLPGQDDAGVVSQAARVVLSPVRPNAELWFLWALVVFFVVGRLISSWDSRVVVGLAVAVSFGWSSVAAPLLGDEVARLLGPGLSKFPMYFVFFIVAARYSIQIRQFVSAQPLVVPAVYTGLWTMVFVVVGIPSTSDDAPGVVFVSQCAGAVLGVSVGVLLQRARPLTYLGKNTLPVYVSHTSTIVVLACTFHWFGLTPAPWSAWLVGLVAVAAGLWLGRAAGDTWLLRAPAWVSKRVLASHT
jgi:uncharacterized membrane protein YcfT